jgi:hypothetical protein
MMEREAIERAAAGFTQSLAIALMLLVTACATAGDLRQGKTDLDEVTNTPSERLAGCIGDRFESSPAASRVRFSTRPTMNGFSISGDQSLPGLFTGGTDTIILVDITKHDTATRIRVWTHILVGTSPLIAVVRTCL